MNTDRPAEHENRVENPPVTEVRGRKRKYKNLVFWIDGDRWTSQELQRHLDLINEKSLPGMLANHVVPQWLQNVNRVGKWQPFYASEARIMLRNEDAYPTSIRVVGRQSPEKNTADFVFHFRVAFFARPNVFINSVAINEMSGLSTLNARQLLNAVIKLETAEQQRLPKRRDADAASIPSIIMPFQGNNGGGSGGPDRKPPVYAWTEEGEMAMRRIMDHYERAKRDSQVYADEDSEPDKDAIVMYDTELLDAEDHTQKLENKPKESATQVWPQPQPPAPNPKLEASAKTEPLMVELIKEASAKFTPKRRLLIQPSPDLPSYLEEFQSQRFRPRLMQEPVDTSFPVPPPPPPPPPPLLQPQTVPAPVESRRDRTQEDEPPPVALETTEERMRRLVASMQEQRRIAREREQAQQLTASVREDPNGWRTRLRRRPEQ